MIYELPALIALSSFMAFEGYWWGVSGTHER